MDMMLAILFFAVLCIGVIGGGMALSAERRSEEDQRRALILSGWPRAVGEVFMNGSVVMFTPNGGHSTCFDALLVGHRTGDRVNVIYDAENPSDAYLLNDEGKIVERPVSGEAG